MDIAAVSETSYVLFTGNTDFLPTNAPPVVSQPQAFTDAMFDANFRDLMSGLNAAHTSGPSLQRTLRQNADHLQRTVHGQFASLKKVRKLMHTLQFFSFSRMY